MSDPDMGYWQYTYDEVGNLKEQVDNIGKILKFEYDAINRLTNKISSASAEGGSASGGSSDSLASSTEQTGITGQTGLTVYITNVDYSPTGQITKIEYGNGNVRSYEYDPLTLRLTHLKTLNLTLNIL